MQIKSLFYDKSIIYDDLPIDQKCNFSVIMVLQSPLTTIKPCGIVQIDDLNDFFNEKKHL